jgi:hypothetical protein
MRSQDNDAQTDFADRKWIVLYGGACFMTIYAGRDSNPTCTPRRWIYGCRKCDCHIDRLCVFKVTERASRITKPPPQRQQTATSTSLGVFAGPVILSVGSPFIAYLEIQPGRQSPRYDLQRRLARRKHVGSAPLHAVLQANAWSNSFCVRRDYQSFQVTSSVLPKCTS